MTTYQLRIPIEDGMKVVVSASPKLTQWGKFSLTVKAIRPSGEGSLKKSFELLKAKLSEEGLFHEDRKRALPEIPRTVAVISSTQAAGYADFMKILDDRWGGLGIRVAQVQVQGAEAPDQIIRAIEYFNQQTELAEVLVIIRGGGSADDLAAFNDEPLVRAIAASRIPTLVGVGHEIDESLADMVADRRAATPSNAAQILVPDRNEIIRSVWYQVTSLIPRMLRIIEEQKAAVYGSRDEMFTKIIGRVEDEKKQLDSIGRVLSELDPRKVLSRGYAIISGSTLVGKQITVETKNEIITAEVIRNDQK